MANLSVGQPIILKLHAVDGRSQSLRCDLKKDGVLFGGGVVRRKCKVKSITLLTVELDGSNRHVTTQKFKPFDVEPPDVIFLVNKRDVTHIREEKRC